MSDYSRRPQESAAERRQRLLRGDWRGVYEAPDLRKFEKKIGDVVQQVLRKAGLNDRLAEESVLREWAVLVGSFLATQSKPTGLRNGVLQVAVLQAAVRYDLERNLKKDILTRLQTRFGRSLVRDRRFVSG